MGKSVRHSYEYVKEIIESEGYKLLSKEYKGNKIKLDMICPEGHFYQAHFNSFSIGRRCRKCSYESNIRNKTQKHSYEFVKETLEKEGYKLLSNSYKNAHSKIKIQCDQGHVYETPFHYFLNGSNRCPICYKKNNKGENHPKYIGGNDACSYDTYKIQLEYVEEVRRNKEDNRILEVKCAYCGKWFIPKSYNVKNRIKSLNGGIGEHRFYCSEECKQECSIYNQKKYPKGYKKASSREVQPELRQMVFERDDWTCQKCGSTKSLNCHHIEGIRWEPLESADIDKCITYCKKCHKEVHKIEECRAVDMKCNQQKKGVAI